MLYQLSGAMYRYATSEKSFVECTIAVETPGCVEEMFGWFSHLHPSVCPFFYTSVSCVMWSEFK